MNNTKKEKKRYLVVGSKSWNKRVFDEIISKYYGHWMFVNAREELTLKKLKKYNPKYIFFLHWSWKIPSEILKKHECVCFHMTNVPYGRGGSPLQNLILRGHRHTKIVALRMVDEYDAGPVYTKRNLCIEGNAEEIYIRACYASAKMIYRIITQNPIPKPQVGESIIFKRRKAEDSRICGLPTLSALYDFIRMLDADGYPHAFIENENFCYTFSRAAYYDGKIIADVIITPVKEKAI